MKKTIYTLLGLLLAAGLTSCQDWFIEKPEVTGMDQDEVFSTAKNAEGAIAEAYATILSSGLPVLVWNNSPIMPYETTEAIMGGEDLCRLTWGYMDKQVVAGMLANNENNGAGYTDDYFPNNYAYIRKAWLVYENIDKVADMSDRDKAIVKAEMQVLVAYRYVEMLKRYGGVPLVESTLTTVDVRPRSTVQQTLDFIVGLCDAAAATLEGVRWPADWLGRVNKGVALAVKAEALMYAARPLFNADAPYMQMADPANNEMIWLGGYDAKRWETARLANQEVIDWGKANGFELIENKQRPGFEEQIDNEKYEVKVRDWSAADQYGIAELLTNLNRVRREHPKAFSYHNLTVLESSDPNILAFARHTPAELTGTDKPETLIVVVNLDGHEAHQAMVHLELPDYGIDPKWGAHIHDELTGRDFAWSWDNFVSLAPWADVAHIFTVVHED